MSTDATILSTASGAAGSQNPAISVVIATLGGESLRRTVERLNRGTLIPSEILVCIPEQEAHRVATLGVSNVTVVVTSCRGQVAQRAVGFQRARYEFVLQLDDDILVRPTCLEQLLVCLGAAKDLAVGPKMYDMKTGKYHSFMIPAEDKISWFQRLLYWVVNGSRGYQPGIIGRAGVNLGVPEEPSIWSDLDWLPGGCVLHRRPNLVLFDFYPFKGKAFAEDLFHSVLLRRKGIRLMRCGTASCDVDFSSNGTLNPVSVLKWYRAYARALAGVVREIGGSVTYLYIYLILNFLGHAVRRVTANRTKNE